FFGAKKDRGTTKCRGLFTAITDISIPRSSYNAITSLFRRVPVLYHSFDFYIAWLFFCPIFISAP
ncbi:MAG: hypothetical protein RR576_11900, partial [Oscillospiraceae bacterium]